MTNETEILSEADEFAGLLPWYVSGKISAADRAKVEAFARTHPEAERQIAIAREEADIVFTENARIDAPHYALDTLMKSVAASPTARLHAAGTSLMDKLGSFLASFAPRQLAYTALAGALALALVAGGIGARLAQSPSEFTVASKDEPKAGQGTFALVTLQPAVPAATLSAFLADNKIAIVDGPRANGLYRVRLSSEALAPDAAKTALEKLKARSDLFATAMPASPSN